MQVYGGFWRRLGAYVIDGTLVGIVSVLLVMVLGFGTPWGDVGARADLTGTLLWRNVISLVLSWLYSAVLESSARQATFGKMALGMVVTNLQGNRISFLRATGRYFAKILSSLILLIGYIMVAFTERKQGLHDMIAGTLVQVGEPGTVAPASVFE